MKIRLNTYQTSRGRKPRFTDEQLVMILKLKAQGLANKEIFNRVAQQFGLVFSRSYYSHAAGHVYRIIRQVDTRVQNGDEKLIRILIDAGLISEGD